MTLLRLPFSSAATLLLAACCGVGSAVQGREAGEELSQAGVQAAFQILRQDYIRSEELDFATLNRAALDGLLRHLQAGARLVPLAEKAAAAAVEPEVLSAVLAEHIGWVRPRTYAASEVDMLATALRTLKAEGCRAVVLDLREPAPGAPLESAAGLANAFVPQGQTLFRLAQAGGGEAELFISTRPPEWEGAVVVLVNGDSSSAGEALAAVLRETKRAVLVGETTRGATARYETLPVDAEFALQYASAEMLLADGRSLFQKGLVPDLEVVMNAEERRASERLLGQGRVRELVHENARPRFNEAALVARRNPELESYLRRSTEAGDEEDRLPVTDAVLQRAVDLLQAHWKLEGFRLSWTESLPGQQVAPTENAPETRRATPVSRSRP